MDFLICKDNSGETDGNYNPVIRTYDIEIIDRFDEGEEDFRIRFTLRNENDYDWFFENKESRDKEFKRICTLINK